MQSNQQNIPNIFQLNRQLYNAQKNVQQLLRQNGMLKEQCKLNSQLIVDLKTKNQEIIENHQKQLNELRTKFEQEKSSLEKKISTALLDEISSIKKSLSSKISQGSQFQLLEKLIFQMTNKSEITNRSINPQIQKKSSKSQSIDISQGIQNVEKRMKIPFRKQAIKNQLTTDEKDQQSISIDLTKLYQQNMEDSEQDIYYCPQKNHVKEECVEFDIKNFSEILE